MLAGLTRFGTRDRRPLGSAALDSIERRGIGLIRPARHRTQIDACQPDPLRHPLRASARPHYVAGALTMDAFVTQVRPLIRLLGIDTAR